FPARVGIAHRKLLTLGIADNASSNTRTRLLLLIRARTGRPLSCTLLRTCKEAANSAREDHELTKTTHNAHAFPLTAPLPEAALATLRPSARTRLPDACAG